MKGMILDELYNGFQEKHSTSTVKRLVLVSPDISVFIFFSLHCSGLTNDLFFTDDSEIYLDYEIVFISMKSV